MGRDTVFRISSMTKPITAVATMILVEECRLRLDEPVDRLLPELADRRVLRRIDGPLEDTVAAVRPITVRDLLTFRMGFGMVMAEPDSTPLLRAMGGLRLGQGPPAPQEPPGPDEWMRNLGTLPLMHQPGERWMYNTGSDVLGVLVARASDRPFETFLRERVFGPLGMVDTAFHVPERHHSRLAEAFANDPDGGAAVQLLEVRTAPNFESGGGGLVSTASDYARFLQMLLNGGILDGQRLLSRKTIELMTSDHLGPITGASDLLLPGHGFGLGFAVRLEAGIAHVPGSIGQYFWGGLAGTTFWVDPAEQMFALMLIQAPGQRDYYRTLFRDLVYAAFDD